MVTQCFQLLRYILLQEDHNDEPLGFDKKLFNPPINGWHDSSDQQAQAAKTDTFTSHFFSLGLHCIDVSQRYDELPLLIHNQLCYCQSMSPDNVIMHNQNLHPRTDIIPPIMNESVRTFGGTASSFHTHSGKSTRPFLNTAVSLYVQRNSIITHYRGLTLTCMSLSVF